MCVCVFVFLICIDVGLSRSVARRVRVCVVKGPQGCQGHGYKNKRKK